MGGNAIEEGLMLQVHNPSHTDPSRFGFLAGAVSGFASVFAASAILPGVNIFWWVPLGFVTAVGVGTIVTKMIQSAREREQALTMQARREMLAEESARQMKAMDI